MSAPQPEVMPSSVSPHVGFFDRFAAAASRVVAGAWFFAACVVLIVAWVPTILLVDVDTWQLIINTVTTIITFLLVALLQNGQARADKAVQHKLNAVAEGLSDVLDHLARQASDDLDTDEAARIAAARDELRCAVGIERRESS